MRLSVLALLALPAISAAAPLTVSHQGRLLDSEGAPIQGQRTLTFRLYDAIDDEIADAAYTETVNSVTLSDGFYSVRLGTGDSDLPDRIATGTPTWLGVSVGSDEMMPRSPLDASAYALRAEVAHRAVSLDTTGACDEDSAGAMRFDTTERTLELCDGTSWEPLVTVADAGTPQRPGDSCADLLAQGVTDDGTYWIDPAGTGSYPVWCDMSGGGWTLIAKTDGSNNNHWGSSDSLGALTTPTTTGVGRTGDTRRTALGRYYRLTCGTLTLYGYLFDNTVGANDNWSSSVLSWSTSFSESSASYTINNSPDCGTSECPGPGYSGRNWMRTAYSGCGIGNGSNYGASGTLWVK